ncbi:hypothetical protein BDF14DRAFT_1957106 [Spinellus fusiger]|nr:hypothetical protein BDF14DRAFT_1957106 [Spinellus fusiger]
MLKEFRYYDRCKHIFTMASKESSTKPDLDLDEDSLDSSMVASFSPTISHESPAPHLEDQSSLTPMPNSQLMNRPFLQNGTGQDMVRSNTERLAGNKRKRQHRITDSIAEERRLKSVQIELETKRMEHDERMQEMKLEQLRLEIELQKLKGGGRLVD